LQLSVIIVNFNVKYFLEQCLYSVIKAASGMEAEIFVVDNNSTDGSKEYLSSRFPLVNFTWNNSNVGFAKANNQALATAKGEYILFLNPDTIVPEDCFTTCIEFFKAHDDAGALGIRMIDGSGKFLKESKRAFPSPLTSLYKLMGLSQLFPHSKVFARYHLGHLSQHENHEVDVLAGAFMMMPLAVLQKTGNFDETFFMYGEDVDLSYRVQKTGYKNYYFAEHTIIHFKGESTKKSSLNYVRFFYKAMSLFVKKHYKGSRAGVFNIAVQTAILARALLTVIARLLKLIGLPLLDAGIILMSFWWIKYLWSDYIRKEVNYSPNMLIIAFPVFTAIFLIISYYSGLYDKGFKQSQLNRATIIASLVLLSGYALLPEELRFSRGILVFGILTAFILMTILRRLFIRWKLLYAVDETAERRQTVVVASESDFLLIRELMQKAGMQERVWGRISNSNAILPNTLSNIEQLPDLVKTYPVKEIIFCEDGLTFKEIITTIELLPQTTRNKFHASGSNSIVGSDSKDISGDYVAQQKKYIIGTPLNKRNKRVTDMLISIFFIITFPVHLVLQKKAAVFFKNVFSVLVRKSTWIGYATTFPALPKLKKGVLTSTGLPLPLNTLPGESLQIADEWYASSYSITEDIKKITRGYKYLSY
jgi:GT2 family glycosyltransferase